MGSPVRDLTWKHVNTSFRSAYSCPVIVFPPGSAFGSDQVLTNDMEEYSYNKSTGNTLLVGIPSSSYVPKLKIGMVGSKHYAVRHYNIPPTSSPILIREEGTHTWRKAPSMKVARENPMVDILDGKIYVMGGCNADESTNWMDILRCLHVRGWSCFGSGHWQCLLA